MPITLGMLAGTPPAPIMYVGKGNGLKTTTQGVVSVHPDTQVGDFLVLAAQSDNASDPTTVSGTWNGIANSLGVHIRFRSWWKWADGMTSFNIGGNGQGYPLVANIFTFRNINLSNPISSVNTANLAYPSQNPVQIPFPNTNVANCYCLALASHNITRNADAIGSSSNSSLVNFQELEDITTTISWDGGFGAFGGFKTAAGAVNPTLVTFNDTASGVRHSFFMRPL